VATRPRSNAWFAFAAVFAALGGSSTAHAASERIALRASTHEVGIALRELRVGGETRPLLASSGRSVLAMLPTEVDSRGKLFAYAPLSPEASAEDLSAEVLVWRPDERDNGAIAPGGEWKRVGMIARKGGVGETASLTTVDPSLKPGAVMTALFRRDPEPEGGRAIGTGVLELPRGARLDFAFAIDELDRRSLSPVTLTVTALVAKRKGEEIERVELFRRDVDPAAEPTAWIDLSLGVAKLAGESVAFEFRSVSKRSPDALATHVAWSVPVIVHEVRGAARPAVIVISLANARARSLACCGAPKAIMPFLDGFFATEGVVFRRAVTDSVTSLASHMSLLTGTSPCRHGVRSARRALDPYSATLAQRFANAGYATAAFSDGGGLVAELGYARGFDRYVELAAPSAAGTLERALGWLAARGSEPVFLFVHAAHALGSESREAYEAHLARLDAALRDFFVKLDQIVDPDRAIVAVTSGHGEEFGEHGSFGHGTQLYEESIGLPMMIRGGGAKRGLQPTALFGLIDLGPTLMQLAGLDAPIDIEGVGHADELRTGVAWGSEIRFVEATAAVRRAANGAPQEWAPPGYAAVEGPLKLIRDGQSGRYAAFNVLVDPNEIRDLLAPGEEVEGGDFNRLRQALDAHAVACEEPAGDRSTTVALPPVARSALHALGYLD
jgi:hypothetical protein